VIGEIVTAADLERELNMVQLASADRSAGVFGPDSVSWRLDREAAIFLGAGRALLLQLGHPWVAAAIAEHSRTLADPISRFHRTFKTVFTMVFGTTDQALAAARALHRRHAEVSGILTESAGAFTVGSSYRANDLAALRWVHATLTDSAVVAYQLINLPLSIQDRERYYTEARLCAALFGIRQSSLPGNWADFAAYLDSMLDTDVLAVSGAARSIAARLLSGAGVGWGIPLWYRALTARLLPPRLRAGFDLPYGRAEHRTVERVLTLLRSIYPRLPAQLRYVAPYHEACGRLAGQPGPRALTRALNRLWIGQTSMAVDIK
jgi:uncharacterized protein (DUF2236 family)